MKKYSCYLRTVLLSIVAAIIIDAVINFDEYKHGWAANFKKDNVEESTANNSKASLPVSIGKVTGSVFFFLFG